jgi:hypothetical protein
MYDGHGLLQLALTRTRNSRDVVGNVDEFMRLHMLKETDLSTEVKSHLDRDKLHGSRALEQVALSMEEPVRGILDIKSEHSDMAMMSVCTPKAVLLVEHNDVT